LPVAVKGPIHLMSMSPVSRASGVDGADPIVLTFSAPLAADSPRPQLTPRVPGSWSVEDNMMVFRSATPFDPASRLTIQVIRAAGGSVANAASQTPAGVAFDPQPGALVWDATAA
jgi:hypothetical protein